MTTKIVEKPNIGDKVIRGKDWCWANQDQGSAYGIIDIIKEDNWVRVVWVDSEGKNITYQTYRVGHNNNYDLYYYEEKNEEFLLENTL